MSEESPNHKDKKEPWLGTFIKNARETKDGDVIAADIGAEAKNVAVGKNIIQIGTLQIPRYTVMLLVGLLSIIGVFVAINAYLNQQAQKDAQEAVAILKQPTPTPTQTPTATPPVMPKGSFNIAVAALNAFDESGQPITDGESLERAQSIANFVSEQADELTKIMSQKVVVWGPDYQIFPIQVGQEVARAAELNANVLIYGNLYNVGLEQWKLEPQFYLTEDAINQAQELAGEHALGRQLTYSNKISGIGKVNAALRIRMEALSKLIYGLSLMTDYNAEGYHEASTIFQDIADNSEWAKAGDKSGQEILQLFLGNAYLAEAQLLGDSSPERDKLLEKSKTAFLAAVELNPEYARSYNGLGSTLFQLSRPLMGDLNQENPCNWQWNEFDSAKKQYLLALDADPQYKPPSGYVDFYSHFGLGRIYFYQGACRYNGDMEKVLADFQEGIKHYQNVLEKFSDIPKPLPMLENVAAYANADLGQIALIKWDYLVQTDVKQEELTQLLIDSTDYLTKAISLDISSKTDAGKKHAIASMPNYLTALCMQGLYTRVGSALDTFLTSMQESENVRASIQERVLPSWEECTNVQS